jgi:hypothetical protein
MDSSKGTICKKCGLPTSKNRPCFCGVFLQPPADYRPVEINCLKKEGKDRYGIDIKKLS